MYVNPPNVGIFMNRTLTRKCAINKLQEVFEMDHAITIGDLGLAVGVIIAIAIPVAILLYLIAAYGSGMSR